MRCISVKQPWAWMIFHAGKNVENRGWDTDYRGPILIHASTSLRRCEYDEAVWWAGKYAGFNGHVPSFEAMRSTMTGIIMGVVTLKGITHDHDFSPWYMDHFGWVLGDARECEPITVRGMLGLYRPNFDAAKLIWKTPLAK